MTVFPLPRHAYVPGTGSEPDRATLERVKETVPVRFESFVPASHPALLYGVRLNDAGFFWESHEILEAVWKAAPKGGLDRICLRGCIQVANANLKLKMGKHRAADRLIAEAAAEFSELSVRSPADTGESLAGGFPAGPMAERFRTWAAGSPISGVILLAGPPKT